MASTDPMVLLILELNHLLRFASYAMDDMVKGNLEQAKVAIDACRCTVQYRLPRFLAELEGKEAKAA